MSALSPRATWQMVSPVAGLMAGNVLPEALSTNLPLMNSGWSLTCGGLTALVLVVVVAVVMQHPPVKRTLTSGGARAIRAPPEVEVRVHCRCSTRAATDRQRGVRGARQGQ